MPVFNLRKLNLNYSKPLFYNLSPLAIPNHQFQIVSCTYDKIRYINTLFAVCIIIHIPKLNTRFILTTCSLIIQFEICDFQRISEYKIKT